MSDPTADELADDHQRIVEVDDEIMAVIPTVQSSESLLSVGSDDTVSSLGKSQLRRKVVGKTMAMDPALKAERVMVPLGESRGNIPVPRKMKR